MTGRADYQSPHIRRSIRLSEIPMSTSWPTTANAPPFEVTGVQTCALPISLPQSQEEFFFSVPYDKLDCCLYGLNNGFAAEEVAADIGLAVDQVEFVYRDIASKRKATSYLHLPPELIEGVLS